MAGRTKHRNGYPLFAPKTSDPINKTKVLFDRSEADRILRESIEGNAVMKASPKGSCYDCDKPVAGQRKLCAKCLNKRNERRINR